MKHLIAGILLLLATTAGAITPDELIDSYTLLQRSPCEDNETGAKGVCFVFDDGDGVYMVFVIGGIPVFIRRSNENGYNQVWPTVEPAGIDA